MNDTIELDWLPDFITLKQYSELIALKGEGTIEHKIEVIALTCGKDTDAVKQLPMQILPQLYYDCVNIYLEKVQPVKAIKIGDVKLLYSVAYKNSVGEFASLETAMKNANVLQIASVLFQEYEGEIKGEWIKINDEVSVIEIDDDFTDNRHLLKKYDHENTLGDSIYEKIPYSAYIATVGFTIGIGMTYSLASGSSQKLTKENHTVLLNETKKITDGLASYVILQKLAS